MENDEALAKSRRWSSIWAAMAGWTLDAMDWMMLALALPLIGSEFHLSLGEMGMLATATLAGAALGGSLVGIAADYYGRVRVLMWTMIFYAAFTAACGFAQSYEQLLALRFFTGIGLGGEWGVGAALVSEYWPKHQRARATAFVHSGFPIGYGLAALAFMYITPEYGWRALFWLGIIPAFVAMWVRISVPEPDEWVQAEKQRAAGDPSLKFPLVALFSGPQLRITLLAIAMTSGALMAYHGAASWLPSYLAKAKGLDIVKTGGYLIVLNAGAFFGYQFFGWLADVKGRRFAIISALVACIAATIVYVSLDDPQQLLLFGPIYGFCTYAIFGIFGAYISELFPANARATATSVVFNLGRGVSMMSPYLIGTMVAGYGWTVGLMLTAVYNLLAVIAVFLLPETQKAKASVARGPVTESI